VATLFPPVGGSAGHWVAAGCQCPFADSVPHDHTGWEWLFLLIRQLGGADDLVNNTCWWRPGAIGHGHEDQ
jgi:hypothetical protein